MAKRWEQHEIPERAVSDAQRHQQRLSVLGLHQRAHSVTDPYHGGARHHHQQAIRSVSAQGQRHESPHTRHSAYGTPPLGQDYGQPGSGGACGPAAHAHAASTSEYRTPSAAEFYAGVWQPPSSPRHSNVPSVGGYQAPEQPVYAPQLAPSGRPSQPMSPPYTPGPGASYPSPAVAYAYTPPPPTPSSPYTYQAYQQPPFQAQPFSPVSPQQPSGAYQAYQEPHSPYQQPQGQFVAYRPPAPAPALKINHHQSAGPPLVATGQSFIAELPADEIPLAPAKPDRQQAVELAAEEPAGKDPGVEGDTAKRWADELSLKFEKTTLDGQQSYSAPVEAPAPLRIRKSTKKTDSDI